MELTFRVPQHPAFFSRRSSSLAVWRAVNAGISFLSSVGITGCGKIHRRLFEQIALGNVPVRAAVYLIHAHFVHGLIKPCENPAIRAGSNAPRSPPASYLRVESYSRYVSRPHLHGTLIRNRDQCLEQVSHTSRDRGGHRLRGTSGPTLLYQPTQEI
ncbi:hypothetical protein BD309DRAFT_535890 [Dichomitus squalens]|uniref:Uncharacterized protein n=1 Tax=Dichomitus squalens TaxID=114155 RepID=A0A4Q9Q157_9APHY|nr:hypothetical protein BD309DRAFT_535890 [Dichomitus squalens]TBU60799.1 hypothetical protein BD310DRAFT_267782 [Dichomitus squalens]